MAIKIIVKSIFTLFIFISINLSYAQVDSIQQSVNDSINIDTVKKVKIYPSETRKRIYGDSYLLDETAYTQGKKTFYYKSYQVILRKISYGLNDNLDLELITLPYVGFKNLSLGVGGKYGYKLNKNMAIALKSSYYNFNKTWRNSAIVTIGNQKNNASISINNLSNPLIEDEAFITQTFYSFNGKLQVKDYISLQFENFFFKRENSLSIFTIDIQKKAYNFSLGFILINENDFYESINFYQGILFSLKVPLLSNKV